MRPEQIAKLTEIEEQLVDIFTTEAKVAEWPDMKTAQSRGDRYWHKKNALATLTLVGRIQTVLRDIRTGEGGGEKEREPGEAEPARTIEQEAAALEKQGVALLRKHRAKRGR